MGVDDSLSRRKPIEVTQGKFKYWRAWNSLSPGETSRHRSQRPASGNSASAGGSHGIIVDVDACRPNKSAELGAMRKMIDRTKERFGLKPDWVAADTAYGSSENLAWLTLKRQILPFIPVGRRIGAQGRHLVSIRLCLGPGQRPLYLPGRQRALSHEASLFRSRPNSTRTESAQIPSGESRLPELPFERKILLEHGCAHHQPGKVRNRRGLCTALRGFRVQSPRSEST